jgi:hypothetical protein
MSAESARKFVRMRRGNVSWALLASRRAALVLGCLKPLFEESQDDLGWEDAVEKLAEMFAEHANHEEFGIAVGEQVRERNYAIGSNAGWWLNEMAG